MNGLGMLRKVAVFAAATWTLLLLPGCDVISPDQDDGSTSSTPVVERTSVSAQEGVQAAADIKEAIKTVGKISVALTMYSADPDHNNMFPSKKNWQESLKKYIDSSVDLSKFVYEGDAVSASSFTDPHTAELGYIQIGQEKEVLYADGHSGIVVSN